jgi:hypothetical protein
MTATADTDAPDTYVKFRGANASTENPGIELGDRVEAIVIGECVAVGTEKRGDGERRPVVSVKVVDVELGAVTKPPKEDQLPFDEDDTPALGSAT